jgi:Zn-dependent M16 (insulinase) family peptidase
MKISGVFTRYQLILLILPLMMSLLTACKSDVSYPGYRLIEKRFVKEVNADCYLFEHIKSGARVLKIAADDPNKTFSIAFSTLPVSDAGTPHIMEHSVLNGSDNFPVKSPFDVLSKGSLNTFLNAMTSDDFTIYPVASMNEKDYFNLMHVYLDAVFNPLIYKDQRIFMQEGWHYELADPTAPLEYKGVVYNEMKGAFSSPEREMWYRIQQNLFPDNAYHFSSGGYPTAIPSLTYEDFIAFHKKNYHPSNSYIYLYGDADLAKELEFIDREYLSKYDKIEPAAEVKPNPAFQATKEISAYYPVIEGSPLDNQTYLSMNWVIGTGADPATNMALDVLSDVLVNQESSPVRKALIEAGVGKDIYATTQNMRQNIFSIVVQNANASDKEKFKRIVDSTLAKVYEEKIDRETLKGSINRMEFRLREGNDAQKGLTYNMRSINCWLYTNSPFAPLEYEKQLTTVKQSLTGTYLEDMIKKELIDNTYELTMVLEPKTGLENEIAAKITNELAEAKKKMTPAELDSIAERTKTLIAFQQKEDSPEAIATIPMLKLSDIKPEAMWYEAAKKDVAGIPHLYFNEFTNGIVYMNFWFDLRVLPQDKIQYAALLTNLLGKMDAGNYDYEQLDKSLNINTGGYSASLAVYLPKHIDNNLIPRFRIQMKTTPEKLDTAFALLGDIITKTKLDNKERLYELLKRHQSQLESSVNQNGFGVALTRLESYYSQRGLFSEKTRGLDYYWFVTKLTKDFNENPDAVIASLKEVLGLVVSKDNLIAGTTCNEADFKTYSTKFTQLAAKLPDNPVALSTWKMEPVAENEGILTASKVQYVIQGFDYNKLGLTWDGKWQVLNQIMSTDWLQTQIRVVGGAYGGFSGITKNGTVYLASYRDPNLSETLKNFKGTVDYLSKFQADSSAMTRYIIGTIANLDYPLTPSEKGEQAFRWYFEEVSKDELQGDREAVLATTATDIKNMSSVIGKVIDKQVFCVYGNSEKINTNKALFKHLVKLQK